MHNVVDDHQQPAGTPAGSGFRETGAGEVGPEMRRIAEHVFKHRHIACEPETVDQTMGKKNDE